MSHANCIACGRTYLIVASHSCGDTASMQAMREATTIERIALETELAQLRLVSNIVYHHFNGDYNKWSRQTPNHVPLVDAVVILRNYFRGKPMKD